MKNHFIIENCRIKRPACLHYLRDITSNLTIYEILLIIYCRLAYYAEILTMLGGDVCKERPELWPIIGFSTLTVSEVTERSVSRSLWRKVEWQSIAVLHTTLFCRQYHCSNQWHHFWANCVATVNSFVDFLQPSTLLQLT